MASKKPGPKLLTSRTATSGIPSLSNPKGYVLLSDVQEITPEKEDADYFDSYADIGIHDTMIKDYVRTATYRRAFLEHSEEVFKGKVVLDCGAGTGILSLFAVQAGAKKVYAVDACNIIDQAKKIVEFNNLSDKIVCIKSKIEDLELPEKVDVIISEWMGYFLIYESMLQSVIYARDKWLKEDGVMFPSHCRIHMAPLSAPEIFDDRSLFWNNVWGFDMSPLVDYATWCHFRFPLIEQLDPQSLIGPSVTIKTINCATITKEEIEKTFCQFRICVDRSGELNGFAAWFDVSFIPPSLINSSYLPIIYTEQDQDESDPFFDPYHSSESSESSNSSENSSTSSTSSNGEDQQTEPLQKAPKLASLSGPVDDANYKGPRNVVLSTAPEIGYTHWQQVQFFWNQPQYVRKGDFVEGFIRFKPFPTKKRSLQVEIGYDAVARQRSTALVESQQRKIHPAVAASNPLIAYGTTQSTVPMRKSKTFEGVSSLSAIATDLCEEIDIPSETEFFKAFEL